MNEQVSASASVNDQITFTYPWILELPPPDEDFNVDEPNLCFLKTMITSYNVASISWGLQLDGSYLVVSSLRMYAGWNASCKVSYKLFIDNDMQVEIFSSSRTSALMSQGGISIFSTPVGFLEEFYDLYEEGNIAKIVFLVELSIPMKTFNRPFDLPLHPLNMKHCNEYPEDMEKNFRFEFLKDGDYSIKCREGSVPALRMVLNLSSRFMMKHFKESSDDELVVEHSLDAVKPVIIFLHSLCFQMPKSFDLDYPYRLIEAFHHFEPEPMEHHDFDSILKWMSVADRYHFTELLEMIKALIVNKFYFKWAEVFPENARNDENPIYRDVFGSGYDHNDQIKKIFSSIEKIFMFSLFTNVILP